MVQAKMELQLAQDIFVLIQYVAGHFRDILFLSFFNGCTSKFNLE